MENQSGLRALRVRELLDGADLDIDAVTTAIRYPLRRTHLAVVAWRDKDDGGDDLASMERFVDQLAESAGARECSLFISVDRLTGWAWIPVPPDDTPGVVARIRAFAEAHRDAPRIAVGNPLPGVEGFRRSHQQAHEAHAVAIASGSNAHRVTAASDPGLSTAAPVGSNLGTARVWVAEVLGPLASCTENDERLRETLRVFLRTGSEASKPPPRNSTYTPTPSNIAYNARSSVVADRSPMADSTSKSRCFSVTGTAMPSSPFRRDGRVVAQSLRPTSIWPPRAGSSSCSDALNPFSPSHHDRGLVNAHA